MAIGYDYLPATMMSTEEKKKNNKGRTILKRPSLSIKNKTVAEYVTHRIDLKWKQDKIKKKHRKENGMDSSRAYMWLILGYLRTSSKENRQKNTYTWTREKKKEFDGKKTHKKNQQNLMRINATEHNVKTAEKCRKKKPCTATTATTTMMMMTTTKKYVCSGST